ncbi:hypothetical protein SteCoe_27607 [Stentor coeruleus]|uniref:non-specific serine/threonine protein kinase n=1 Tax=Stentor coeruleus TaxID=5963 RepID=A0A1R2BA64_9CILI|nr:hypothetical protein SteCoe_27607 [Stentor coeruleus]
MEYCDYFLKLVKTSICCKGSPSHHQGSSIGTINLSDNSIQSSIIEPIHESENPIPQQKLKPQTNQITEILDTKSPGNIEDFIVSQEDNVQDIWDAIDNNDVDFLLSCFLSHDINSLEDSEGLTPLHRGVIAGNFEVTEILSCRLDVSAKDKLGRTALHHACIHGKGNIVKELIKKGASVSDFDVYGKAPLDYAGEYEEITEILYHSCEVKNGTYISSKELISSCEGNTRIVEKIDEVEKDSTDRKECVEKIDYSRFKVKALTQPRVDMNRIRKFKDFNIIKVLGVSYLGEVYLIKDIKTRYYYAMKVFKKNKLISEDLLKIAQSEKNLLSKLIHPFIIPLIFSFQTNENLMLVSHFCKHGTIASQIGCKIHIKTDIIRLYACELITALEYIHSQGYIYQALTPKNILINEDGHIMLSNFQMARPIINTNSKSPIKANMAYLPPEIVKGEPYKTESEWYALGLVLYEMATCQPYFFEEKFGKIEDKSLEDLIKNLLNPIPNKRLGFKQGAKKIKSHYFFSTIDWNMIINKNYIIPVPALTDIDPQFVDLHVSDDEEVDKDLKIQDWSFISPI